MSQLDLSESPRYDMSLILNFTESCYHLGLSVNFWCIHQVLSHMISIFSYDFHISIADFMALCLCTTKNCESPKVLGAQGLTLPEVQKHSRTCFVILGPQFFREEG